MCQKIAILSFKNHANFDADFLKPCYGLATRGGEKIDAVSFNIMCTVWGSFKLHTSFYKEQYVYILSVINDII
jgi:hypothetical protein